MDGLLDHYDPASNTYDEMLGRDGGILPSWQGLMDGMQQLPPGGLEQFRRQANRTLKENGVTYHVHGAEASQGRAWELDAVPFVLGIEDWQRIEAGLCQRAELLNHILCDVYGPQTLLEEGRLPFELIFEHQGFLRPLQGVPVSGERRVVLYGADIARGPDGRMWIINDRTQAPAGAGYALENRTATAQIMKGFLGELGVRRLAGFFRAFRGGLIRLAPEAATNPRIVVFTPGPYNASYFEHAYLATYLGYNLVEGGDLTVRNYRVWMKTLEGLKRVDVLLRRVGDSWCDPLELRGESQLGVPGLVECVRQGTVTVVNALGSSVIENPGLMSFLPGLSKKLLGEDLLLPSAASWWCGQEKECRHVLDHLEDLVIKPINRRIHSNALFGDRLSGAEREELAARIQAHPASFVGQQRVSFSTAPAFNGRHLEPRYSVMRMFVAWDGERYIVMPGGLTRSAADRASASVSMSLSGLCKDTWVLGGRTGEHRSAWLNAQESETPTELGGVLSSREGENLFWVGRYAERSEFLAHLLRDALRKYDEQPDYSGEGHTISMHRLLRTLTRVSNMLPGFIGKDAEKRLNHPEEELRMIGLDAERAGSLTWTLHAMTRSAFNVRDLWSEDTWRVLGGIDARWSRLESREGLSVYAIQAELDRVLSWLKALAGLVYGSMSRGSGWRLQEMGRRIERSWMIVTSLRELLLEPMEQEEAYEVLETALRVHESLITYRRRFRTTPRKQAVIELLLFDLSNPRSLAFQFQELHQTLEGLPHEKDAAGVLDAERCVTEAIRQLEDAHTLEPMATEVLGRTFDDTEASLLKLSNLLSHRLFTHVSVSRTAFGFRHLPGE